jgi:hypothetical protein
MSTRWIGRHREFASPRPSEASSPKADAIFPREEASWRSWLATGARRVPIDRRRARGAESHLKRVLVGAPSGAVDFSSAMARQAIDEALHELPAQQKQVVKLAYFGGLTNREIAQELGLSVSEVRRVLRAGLATVGAHFERGRAKGRRAIQDLLMLPWWRTAGGLHRGPWPPLDHALQTGIVAVMTAAAAALLVTHQAPVHAGHTHRAPHAVAAGSVGASLQSQSATLDAAVIATPRHAPSVIRAAPASAGAVPATIQTLLSLPVTVTIPSGLSKPVLPGLPQLPFGE